MSAKTRLRIARLILWLDRPFLPITMWAARVVVSDNLRKAGLPDLEDGAR